jgi:hypothetical protein
LIHSIIIKQPNIWKLVSKIILFANLRRYTPHMLLHNLIESMLSLTYLCKVLLLWWTLWGSNICRSRIKCISTWIFLSSKELLICLKHAFIVLFGNLNSFSANWRESILCISKLINWIWKF